MELTTTFEKGMIKEFGDELQPKGSYSDATNMVQKLNGTMETEEGTKLYASLPSGYRLLAHSLVNNVLVVLSVNDTHCEVGKIIDGTYYRVKNTTKLNLTIADIGKVNMIAKLNYNKRITIYIVDGKSGGTTEGTVKSLGKAIDIDSPESWDKLGSTSLSPNQQPSEVDVTIAGGTLPVGVYQVTSRLVSGSGATTDIGALSSIIPITAIGGFGANEGTNSGKGLSISFTNVDTSYAYIEPIVITRVGASNSVVVHTLERRPISGSNITVPYTSTIENSKETFLEELVIRKVAYESAKYMCQKDGHLLVSNLSVAKDNSNWQSVANKTKIEWVTKDLTFEESLALTASGEEDNHQGATVISMPTGRKANSDYKSAANCYDYRGYKRNEVYSFTFTPVFKDGSIGNAYHIPASSSRNQAANRNGVMGTAISTSLYPESFGTALENTNVRYHRMPTNYISPCVTFSGGVQTIHALGIKVTVPIEVDNLYGYIIGREVRTEYNSSILCQGIMKPVTKTDKFQDYDKDYYTQDMLFGGTKMRVEGWYDPDGFGDNSKRFDSYFSGYSATNLAVLQIPDYNLNTVDLTNMYGIAPAYTANHTIQYENFTTLSRGSQHRWDYLKPKVVSSQTGLTPYANPGASGLSGIISESHAVSGNADMLLNDGTSVKLPSITPSYLIKTTENLSFAEGNFTFYNREHASFSNNSASNKSFLGALTYNIPTVDIKTNTSSYYGEVTDISSVEVAHVYTVDAKLSKTVTCFGGDTFICKVPVSNVASSYVPNKVNTGNYVYDFREPTAYQLMYTFIETKNNYNFVHRNVEGVKSTVPLLDREGLIVSDTDTLGIWDYEVEDMNSIPYNKQYSITDSGIRMFSLGLGEESVEGSINRTQYSEVDTQDSTVDGWRDFKPANIHDIPNTKGEITGIFVHNNTLYHHTTYSLWRSSFNDMATQATSVGEVVLGNGGAFNRPSVEISTIEGGYAGCQDHLSNVETPVGRIFIDKHQRKLFLLGQALQDITTPAMSEWFVDNIADQDSFVAGYDSVNNRYLLTNINKWTLSYNIATKAFVSFHTYKPVRYLSFGHKTLLYGVGELHELGAGDVGAYLGTKATSKIRFIVNGGVDTNILYTHIDYVLKSLDKKANISKMKFYTDRRNTGDLTVVTPDSVLSEYPKLGEIQSFKFNNIFRANIPQDLVADVDKDIHNITNLVTYKIPPNPFEGKTADWILENGKVDEYNEYLASLGTEYAEEDKLFRPDITGGYLVVELEFDNTNKEVVEIKSFKTNLEQYIL